VAWINLAENRNKWRALVRAVLKLQVPQNTEGVSTGRDLLAA